MDDKLQSTLRCLEYRNDITKGVLLSDETVQIRFKCEATGEDIFWGPALVLYDANDAKVHYSIEEIAATNYIEYGEIWLDGHVVCTEARNMKISPIPDMAGTEPNTYVIEASRVGDHASIVFKSSHGSYEVIVALVDRSRYAYLGLTGENCLLSEIEANNTGIKISEADIPRIADEVSYIGRLESDLPNVQVNGIWNAWTKGVPVTDGLRVEFHSRSLPAADSIWHCPYVMLYYSDDGQAHGEGYREFMILRTHGDKVDTDPGARNNLSVEFGPDFKGWDDWKEQNRRGMEFIVSFSRWNNRIITCSENHGIIMRATTDLDKDIDQVYMAITGDLVAITDIRLYDRSL